MTWRQPEGDFLKEVVFEQDLKNAWGNLRRKCGLKRPRNSRSRSISVRKQRWAWRMGSSYLVLDCRSVPSDRRHWVGQLEWRWFMEC